MWSRARCRSIWGMGRGLIGKPGDMIFVPPLTEHSLQAIEDEPVNALSVWAL